MSRVSRSAGDIAEALIASVGKKIVLGLPVGIGKATHIADALFSRAAADPEISLTIFTGLTLEPPVATSDVERRFIGPLVERLYAGWPVPAYAAALRNGALPANVRVHEFYLRPGAWLGSKRVQQNYASINYSQVAAELRRLGINVIAQLVSVDEDRPGRYSLSSNPEITLELLPYFDARRQAGDAVAIVAEVNRNLPYMGGAAELDDTCFDRVLDEPALAFPLFPLPNRPVSPADYATAMHVASLVPDGGTLQLGIGSLSDAVAHCLTLRDASPGVFRKVLERLPGGTDSPQRAALPVETEPFDKGLFASSELLSDALFALFEAGLLRRAAGAGDAAVIHAGFFVGSAAFYQRLRSLPAERRALIRMAPISEVNTLYGDEARKRAQRRDAVFVNETMMLTLLGAAVSDGLEDGRVVSGVGGQFDFVQMAHELDGAHSILMCRARRMHGGVPQSNLRWSYGHQTVPRHHRDIYVTEYGVAATRGLSDRDVIDAMLGVADAAFQDGLVEKAKAAGKLEAGYRISDSARRNRPDELFEIFDAPELRDHFPTFPLGTDFTREEQDLIPALGWLAETTARPMANVGQLARALTGGGNGEPTPEVAAALARMDLDEPEGLKERALARLLRYGLEKDRR